MSPSDPISRRDRLFDEALALPPTERAAFLEQACPDDPELRDEVRSLVEADAAASGFFEGLSRDWVSPLRSAGVGMGMGASPHLPVGSRVARYEIAGVLGEGGMGVVYRARDPHLERDVALKLLPPHAVGNPAARAELMAEARRVARLDHPHVGVIHEVGETEDAGVYLAMACHEGETLADRLRRGPLPLPASEVLRIGRGVAAALEAAHREGIVHRDVKPSNVLLTTGGGLRLVDFGIAAAVGEAALPRGSRGYASPEILAASPADHRTDLWSLGILLHEMATGVRPPPHPEGLPALDAVEAGGTLSNGLARVIRACLDPDPTRRPESAAAVARLLEEAAVPPAGPATAPPIGPPSRRTARPVAWALAGALGLAVVFALLPRGSDTEAEEPGPVGATLWGEAHRVLVLPFEDRTGDPALAMVGSMAADWIAEGIAGAAIANVVDGGAAVAAARDARDPVEAASVYRAGLVVTGAYYLDRDSLRLAARIVDGVQGTLVRALDPVATPREDALAGIEPLRQATLTAVALHLDPLTTRHELMVIQRPPPLEAYLAYVRGKDHFIESRMAQAREEFVLAEELAPDFHLAIFYGAIAAANLGDREDLEARRDRLAPFADRMNRPTRLGLDFLDAILARDHEASYRIHRRGVEEGILAPGTMGHAELILQAVTLGRFEEAIAVAREVDPLRGEVRGWVSFWSALAMAHYALGEFQTSLETALRAREAMGPLRHEPLYLEMRARAALGDLAGVDALVQAALRGHPRPAFFLADAGDLLRLHGHREEGMRRYREAVARARADRERDPDPDRDWVLAEALLALAAGAAHEGEAAVQGDPGEGPAPGEAEAATLEAQDLFRALHELNPHFVDPPTGLGRAAALLGNPDEAMHWSNHLAGVDPEGRTGHLHLRRARIAALLGDVDGMVEALELAYRGGYRTQFAFRDDPNMMRHRDHPAMAALLRPR
jgi:tetratricopeptide (TPR) repeat protein/TolB-like protein